MLNLEVLLVNTGDTYKKIDWGDKGGKLVRNSKYGGVFEWETKDPKIKHEIWQYLPASYMELFHEAQVRHAINTDRHPAFWDVTGLIVGKGEENGLAAMPLPNGSLDELLDMVQDGRAPKQWDGTLKSKLAFGLPCAMLHLHRHKAFHRKLSPPIIRFDEQCDPRICDFSSVCFESERTSFPIEDDAKIYIAPEILAGKYYGEKSDVYSYGMILYAIVTGKKPVMPDIEEGMAVPECLRPDISGIGEEHVHLIVQCWHSDPDQRPSFMKILQDLGNEPFFSDADTETYMKYRATAIAKTNMTDTEKKFLLDMKSTGKVSEFDRVLASAESGDVDDMVKLGKMYAQGDGTCPDGKQAYEWYKRASEKGDITAMYLAGIALLRGMGTDVNPQEGFRMLESATKGRVRFCSAELACAICHENGIGTPVDKEKALKVYEELAQPPYTRPEAIYGCARVYETKENYPEAVKFYKLAIERGILGATHDYALMLLQGKGVPADIKEGMRLLEELAKNHTYPIASFDIGLIHEKKMFGQGDEATKDVISLLHYRKAAEGGHVPAMLWLAKRLRLPDAKNVDPREVFDLLERASAHKNPFALCNLGKTLLDSGRGKEAVGCLAEAAKYNNGEVLLRIGEIFENLKDLDTARQCYERARDLDTKEAQEKLDKLPHED